MDAIPQSIHYVLSKNATSFFIPPFQRSYAWGKTEIERYFNDITRIIDSELNSEERDKLEHFFGTVVIKEESAGFASKSIVIDGQQRLTTTLIFLIALRDSEKNQDNIDYINNTYLTNPSSSFEDKIKLKQVTKDWDAYKALINKETQLPPNLICNAYNIFKKLIRDYAKKASVNLEQYIIAIQRMKVVVIFLNERPHKGEDPQIIFETLNSLGKPLTLSDLVRNYILLGMESEKQTDIYEITWHPKIEKILDSNTSKFFRDYLQYKTSYKTSKIHKVVSESNTKELYQEFKNFVETEFKSDKQSFVDDITGYVEYYHWIITEEVNDTVAPDKENDKTIKELLRNIFHDIQADFFKPVVLGLLKYHADGALSDEILIDSLTTIRTYLIRRRILKITQGENNNIPLLSKYIAEIANGEETMLTLLTNLGYNIRFPNDKELREKLQSIDFYNELGKYVKFILGKIEENETKVAVPFRNKKITVEHIMPQKLGDSWEEELGDNCAEVHQTYKHNIGNLILTEFNSEIGNKPFAEKQGKLKESNLHYRLDVIDKENWNEDSIIAHQEKMIERLLQTFSLPEKYQNANWNKKNEMIDQSQYFSPLEIGADEMVKWNNPIELKINENVIKVESWRDVFVEFMKYLKDRDDFDFDFILFNQSDFFNKDDVILKWQHLKELSNNKPKLLGRYKTFDNKTCKTAKALNDETLCLYVNNSAPAFITRIGDIMQKFNMSEEEVQIKLR